jgi:hypothetical protein
MGIFVLALALAPVDVAGARGPDRDGGLRLEIDPGEFAREDAVIRVEVPDARLAASVHRALEDGPIGLELRETGDGAAGGEPVTVQAERAPGESSGRVRLIWILTGRTPAHAHRRFQVGTEPVTPGSSPWTISERPDGSLELKNGQRTVFRYNGRPVSHPNYGPIQARDAYIHPAFTPTGALITGDFSRFHPHHRGFFLAYTKTEVGGLHPDFWNIQSGTGKIACERVGPTALGPVTARFSALHRWEASGGTVVLRERWDVEAFHIPGQTYWLFDLTSTPPYRYGGMAYRGPEPFVQGPLDVLTSEGLSRKDGDQEPARWVDLTGPIAEGSARYAGAMILDHPGNVNHPTVARIHPTTLPFFCFVPGHDETVTIGAAEPTVFRYRILIHDGHPDRVRNERIWHDFADPVRVVVAPSAPLDEQPVDPCLSREPSSKIDPVDATSW